MADLLPLYSRDAKGKLREWRIMTIGSMVIMSYGLRGMKMKDEKYRAEGKNAGRSNETTPEQQAEAEAVSAWQKKRDEGYDTDPAKALAMEVLLPMLAHRFDKHEKKVKFPCDLQRKYNGMRCLALVGRDNKTTLISRQGKVLIVPHISGIISNGFGFDGDLFDGELYCYGLPLQTIVSLAKDNRPESLKLYYYVYDMPKISGHPTLPWSERRLHLEDRFATAYQRAATFGEKTVPPGASAVHATLALAETKTVNDMSEVADFERISVTAGFEGIMLRSLGAEYRMNVRSHDLLKLKRFQDAEFEIVDVESRLLSANDTILSAFVFQNNTSEATFKAVPIGTHEQKKTMWVERDGYLGRRMTVRFLERSTDGIPIGNPVAVGFKDPTEGDPDDDEDGMWTNKAE
jgi:ATP-dependent DNA ligase